MVEGAIVDQVIKRIVRENYGVFNVPSRLNVSISFLIFTLSILGTGTLLYNIYTSHVSEKKKLTQKILATSRVNVSSEADCAINNELLFMKQPFNYRSLHYLGLNHFVELRAHNKKNIYLVPS